MNEKKKILLILGTRPEAIKMAPLILALSQTAWCELRVCLTGQHAEMVAQVFEIFALKGDYDLKIMRPRQTLTEVTVNVLRGLEEVIKEFPADLLLAQGDTTSAMSASLAAFYHRIKVGHIEAGLRTGDKYSPYPEEANRAIITQIADFHFAPTELSEANLLRENISKEQIFITGNTAIDALHIALGKLDASESALADMEKRFSFLNPAKKLVLVTAHRRENQDGGIYELCQALKKLVQRNNVEVLLPIHPSPAVGEVIRAELSEVPGVHLTTPVDYWTMLYIMRRSYMIISDSGGIQEEAPSLGKPVLVTRDTTERPEALEAGTIRLTACNQEKIIAEAELLFNDPQEYQRRCLIANPFGDGHAAERIVQILQEKL